LKNTLLTALTTATLLPVNFISSPLLNLKDKADIKLYHNIARDVALPFEEIQRFTERDMEMEAERRVHPIHAGGHNYNC